MRLFTGLDLPPDVIRNLDGLMARLRPAARIQWSSPANLHVTTKFIGEWPPARLEELKTALGRLASRHPIPLAMRQLGFFPNAHSPRLFWCGVEAPGLDTLAADTDAATTQLGVARETRPFAPHLTLARIKDRLDVKHRLDLEPLRRTIAGLPSLEFGQFESRTFFLYQSTLKPTGSVYTKLAEFPLAK
jgi:RNA 2',3'-cyclic 3'-phosphodiesterase